MPAVGISEPQYMAAENSMTANLPGVIKMTVKNRYKINKEINTDHRYYTKKKLITNFLFLFVWFCLSFFYKKKLIIAHYTWNQILLKDQIRFIQF